MRRVGFDFGANIFIDELLHLWFLFWSCEGFVGDRAFYIGWSSSSSS